MIYRFATKRTDGTVCCAGHDENFPRCQNCKGVEMQAESYAPPNPWALTAAQQAERLATPELRAEVEYKNRRMREFAAEYARAAAFNATRPAPRVLSAAELAQYAPPNSYPSLKKEHR
jgi:hypothetical protein